MKFRLNYFTIMLTLFLLFGAKVISAQHVQVNIAIPPPYPIHLEDYIFFSNQTVITLQNTSNEARQIKLIATMTGDNGVSAAVKPSFIPVMPIVLNPMETKIITGAQLRSINGNVGENDVDVTGTSKSLLMQTETLPEGYYSVCIEPYDYNTGESYSSPAGPGCTNFFLSHYDVPEIIIPAFEQEIIATTPQFVNFAWTPSGLASNTRYKFELVDMEFNNLLNINDAFANPSVQLHFTQSNIFQPNLQYDMTKLPLIVGHQYAVRITAYDPSQQTVFKNNGEGPVSTFFYIPNPLNPLGGNNNNNNIIIVNNPQDTAKNHVNLNWNNNFTIPDYGGEDPPQDQGDCLAVCTLPAISQTPGSIKQNIPVSIGFFEMNITQLNGNSGEGTIMVDFLKTRVKVVFNNLSVNENHAMLSGNVYAKLDQGSAIPLNVSNNENANLEVLYTNMNQILQEVSGNSKKVSKFNINQAPVSLPISMDNKSFDLVVVGLIFKSDKAYINLMTGVETITNSLSPYLGLSKNAIGIRPNGFCNDTQLQIGLAANQELSIVNNGPEEWVKMVFNGAPAGTKTHLKFNCSGVTELSIDAEINFGRGIISPVTANGSDHNGNVKMAIKKVMDQDIKDWYMENPTMTPTKFFTVPALKGFVMEATNIIYDQHASYTPPGMKFHPQHPNAGGDKNMWKGLYIGGLSLTFPVGFNKGGQALKFNVDNMILDKTGLWGVFSMKDLLELDEGDLGGWAFSIDKFNLDIQESKVKSGGFEGNIELPITQYGVPYSIALAGQDGNEYKFGISPNTDISVDMWIASLKIGNSSSIKITKAGDKFIPSAELNGDITISWDKAMVDGMDTKPSIGKFKLPTLSIEGMKIITENGSPKIASYGLPSIDNLNLPQGEFLAFKINLKDIGIVNKNGETGLEISLGLGFDDRGSGGDAVIGGTTTLTFFPKFENKKFKFGKTEVNEVIINATVGPVKIDGGLTLYNQDDIYGEGFRGFIKVQIEPMGLNDLSFTLQVGTAPQDYRYWMFDASISLSTGIPCGPGVALYGFGGGFWYNMTREGPKNDGVKSEVNINDMVNVTEVDMTPGKTENGITYTPKPGAIGFQANVIIGLAGSSAAFNADVGFVIQLEDDFAFKYMKLYGHAYMMQDMTDRSKSLLTGKLEVEITGKHADPMGPIILGHVSIEMNVETLVDINVYLGLDFMFSAKEWYVNFGSWNTETHPNDYDPFKDNLRNRIEIAIPVINVNAQFNCYFMIGTQIPSNLPPLPPSVREFFKQGPGQMNEGAMATAKYGKGFALGAGFGLDVDLSFAILYVKIEFKLGFDALVTKIQGDCGKVTNPGIGGWYAKGQAYAYCSVAGGLRIDIWFVSGDIPFAKFTAGALLQAQGPNPTWLKGRIKFKISILGGLIKVESQIMAEVGEKCDDGLGNPFDDIPIVSHVDPMDGSSKVDCYTNPQIIFNFPKEPFKYEIMDENDPKKTVIRAFSYTLKSYNFTYKDPETNKITPIETEKAKYSKDGYSAYITNAKMLPALTPISYEIRTAGHEHYMDGYLIKGIKETFPDQVEKGVFTTDSFPDYIPIKQLIYAIPGMGQRYFLKNEQAQGEIFLFQTDCEILFKKSDKDYPDVVYSYIARFTELATNKVYEVDCYCNNFMVTYAIPPALLLSKIYKLEILRQSAPIKDEVVESKSKENWRKIGHWDDTPDQIKLAPDKKENNNLDKFKDKVNMNKQIDLNLKDKNPQKMLAMEVYDREFVESITSVKVDEKILFTNWFKNSKYKTVSEKTHQMSSHSKIFSAQYAIPQPQFEGIGGGYLNAIDYLVEVPVMLLKTDEGFDQYDVKGYFWSEFGGDPENLNYNIHTPIFNLTPEGTRFWLENKYNTQFSESVFLQPDKEDFKYKMDIYDPAGNNPLQPLAYEENEPRDLRKYIFWPDYDDWAPYMPTFLEEDEIEIEGINRPFWRGDRFAQLAVFENLNKDAEDAYNKPFMINDFKKVQKVKPSPQEFGHGKVKDEFVPAEWYSYKVHQHIDFEGLHVTEPEGHLTWYEIQKEAAKAPQEGNPGNINNFAIPENKSNGNLNPILQNQMNLGGMEFSANPSIYVALIDYSEWMAKRDHIRMTNKILYEFRERICIGCGINLNMLMNVNDALNPNDPNIGQDPKGGEIDYGKFKYSFMYLPMRAWLLHVNYYKKRPSEDFRFKLGGKDFIFNVPQYNQNDKWPSSWTN